MITTVEHRAEATRVLLTVPGPDLGLAIADELRSRLSAVKADAPAAVIIVDLSAVTFTDCALTGLNGLFHRESDPSEATRPGSLAAPARAPEDPRPVPARGCAYWADVSGSEGGGDRCEDCSCGRRIPLPPDVTDAGADAIQEA